MNKNERVGAFVTNRWLVAVLVTMVMAMGGYIFQGLGKSSDAVAAQIDALWKKTSSIEVESASRAARTEAQYAEILRRLERIESRMYR